MIRITVTRTIDAPMDLVFQAVLDGSEAEVNASRVNQLLAVSKSSSSGLCSGE